MNIVIIDYGAGNTQSVVFALERIGARAIVTSDKECILAADKVIFPGVGQAAAAMKALQKDGLDTLITTLKQPVLGVCLGMQLLCKHTQEGNIQGLGIIDVDVKRFEGNLKVPQIGWNQVYDLSTPLFQGVNEKEFVYLVHSYYAPLCHATIAKSDYGEPYSAALCERNFYGCQFHPEKSSAAGQQILENFIALI
ncbi:MAG: imidazole glycerol phosphate synthase subunit HisH [Flavobacteriaceae bacterium]|nr:imidazole glycerol phosphate synthase subunit HisH [Flavobacteriaceae bacterium]